MHRRVARWTGSSDDRVTGLNGQGLTVILVSRFFFVPFAKTLENGFDLLTRWQI